MARNSETMTWERSTRERTFVPRSGHLYLNVQNENESENKNATGEDTYAGALRAPRAGSPACVSGFVVVLIDVYFELPCKIFGPEAMSAKVLGREVWT